jgi:hypothetical protein
MSLTRRRFVFAAGAAGLAMPGVIEGFAQDALAELPEGPLREQVVWFIDTMNSAPDSVTAGEIAEHFSEEFLAQVPAADMLAIVEQMKPLMGRVIVVQATPDTTGFEASVLLAGGTGLYLQLTMVVNPESGLIDGLLLQPAEAPDAAAPAAVASPAASAAASPVAVASPPATGEILADYQSASGALLTAGRELTEAFIAGDDEALMGMFSEQVAILFAGFSSQELMSQLQENIVSFSIAEFRAFFAGQYTPEGISGLFHQGTPAAFELAPEEPQIGTFPTGLWTGNIIIGSMSLGIEVMFSGTAETLAATISIPEQGLVDHPLSHVRFDAERPLGDLVAERALPMEPSMGTSSYGALYVWGDSTLAINSAFDADNMVIGISPVMQPPLPDDPAAGVTVATTFELPFDGAWMVVWGGHSEFRNYHAPTAPQRYAHDIVIWRDGSTYTGDGSRNEQYHCYGQPQYAPAAGTVVTVVDEYPDDTPGSAPTSDPTIHPAGNHVVIAVGEGEYVLMAHFIPGSLAVAEGDIVSAGEQIGLTGNSGNSSEPHVHIHLQSTPDMFEPAAIGLPMEFTNVLVNGEPRERASIEQGQIIERA